MSINQKQFQRIQTLHDALVKKQRVTWQQIQQMYQNKLNIDVSKRTVYNDIGLLRDEFEAPIERDKGAYFYTKSFSLFRVFNPTDLDFAAELVTLFEQLAVLPHIHGLEEVRLKIKEKSKQSDLKPTVQFEQNGDYSGLKHLNTLYDKIREKEPLKITYKDFDKEIKTYSISPYLLKEYANRWHVYGYEVQKNKIYNLALDRILHIETSILPYREQKPSELDFLQDLIGFTYLYHADTGTYQPLEDIQIAFQMPRAHYVRTKPLHESQEEVKALSTPERVVFAYRLHQNLELVAKIMEFGADAEVLQPTSLRERIKQQVAAMHATYFAKE